MLSFEDAGRVLDEAAEALPEGIFEELNGGVNLLPEEKLGEDGRWILGLYHNDRMGRYVEIFYGSFLKVYPEATDAEFAAELRRTLHHELTHHVEGLAGDRTLERWDEEQKALWEASAQPLKAQSVLFVDADGTLARQADALFRDAALERRLNVRSGWCALPGATEALLDMYEAILCMTLEQAEALAERFPAADEKILCLGEKDILPDRRGTERTLRREIEYLAEELAMEDLEP
jgi:hypothetical protein